MHARTHTHTHTHTQVERGSEDLLQQAEEFGLYLSSSLRSPTVDTTSYGDEINIKRENIGALAHPA